MKQFFGLVLIITGILIAAYVGIWVCLVSGIIGVCNIVHAMTIHSPWSAGALAWDIIRIVLADSIAAIIGFAIAGVGFKLAFSVTKKSKKF